MKTCACCLALLLGLGIACAEPYSWDENGMPVVRAGGVVARGVVTNDAGQRLVYWMDEHLGSRDIFAQLLDSAGTPLWPEGGVPVDDLSGHLTGAAACAVADGFIFTWVDFRDDIQFIPEDDIFGGGDVWVQKLDLAGNRLWSEGEVPGRNIFDNTLTVDRNTLRVVPDGAGGAYVTWQAELIGRMSRPDLYLQRVSADGQPLWTDPVFVSDAVGLLCGTLAADGFGNAIVCWGDGRPGDAGYEIFAQKFGPDGTPRWGETELTVCARPANQHFPRLCADGAGGVYVAWQDFIRGQTPFGPPPYVTAQRLDSTGNLLWGNGVDLLDHERSYFAFNFAPSLNGGFVDGCLLGWRRSYNSNIDGEGRVQKLSPEGLPLWGPDGALFDPDITLEFNLASDGAGGTLVAWRSHAGGQGGLRFGRHSAAGTSLWQTQVTATSADWIGACLVGPNAGLAFARDLNGEGEVRVQSFDLATGALLQGPEGLGLTRQLTTSANDIVSFGLGDDRTAVLWRDGRASRIYLQILDSAGTAAFQPNGRPLTLEDSSAGAQRYPKVCPDDHGGFFVNYVLCGEWDAQPWLIRVSGAGEALDSSARVFPDAYRSSAAYPYFLPSFSAADGAGGCYVAAYLAPASGAPHTACVMRMTTATEPAWPHPVSLSWQDRYGQQQTCNPFGVVATADQGCIVAATTLDSSRIVVAFGLAPDGSLLWQHVLGHTTEAVTSFEDALSDHAGGAYVLWDNRSPQSATALYIQRLSPAGELLWAAGGMRIGGNQDDVYEAHVDVNTDGLLTILWAQGDLLRMQRINPGGVSWWGEDGQTLNANAENFSFSVGPDLSVFAVWPTVRPNVAHACAMHWDVYGTPMPDPWWGEFGEGGLFGNPFLTQGNPRIAARTHDGCVVLYGQRAPDYIPAWSGNHLCAQRFHLDFTSAAAPPAPAVPVRLALHAAYPNPFNPRTTISFDLPQTAHVKLMVYDLLGREVAVLENRTLAAGTHHIPFDATALASGVYFYRLEAGAFSESRKMLLLK